MSFVLGAKSIKELEGVHDSLIAVVNRAIEITTVDFAVHDGLRTQAEQQRMFDTGASRTLKSKHIFGHAVDLVPYVNGKLRWEWGPIYLVTEAVLKAAIELDIRLRWGGIWDRILNDLDGTLEEEVKAYCIRHPGPDFIDGPHYEIP